MKRAITLALAAGLFFGTMTAASATEKRFSVRCEKDHAAKVDPIVAPGEVSMHWHQFFGNRHTNRDSHYRGLQTRRTSCGLTRDTAAYWVPTLMYRDSMKPIPASHMLAYYRSTGALSNMNVQPFPKGLKMVSYDFEWLCKDTQAYPTKHDCSGGEDMGLRILFPACWDGKHLDSADHLSHMAEQTSHGCPASHPVPVPKLALNVRWDVSDATDTMLSSEMMGTGPHGDFFNTWQQGALNLLTDHCLGAGVSHRCSLQTDKNNDLGGH
jgi:hypothetical protein